jgi:hypothetical protein
MKTIGPTRLVKTMETQRGYAIGIISQDINSEDHFSVIRINEKSQYVTLSHHGTNATEAEKTAYKEWASEKGGSTQ